MFNLFSFSVAQQFYLLSIELRKIFLRPKMATRFILQFISSEFLSCFGLIEPPQTSAGKRVSPITAKPSIVDGKGTRNLGNIKLNKPFLLENWKEVPTLTGRPALHSLELYICKRVFDIKWMNRQEMRTDANLEDISVSLLSNWAQQKGIHKILMRNAYTHGRRALSHRAQRIQTQDYE